MSSSFRRPAPGGVQVQIRVLAFLAASIVALPLMASPVTYTYTGNDFTTATGPDLTTSDSVTGSFTVASPLGDNLNGANIAGSALSYSFSDGPDTITNTTPNIGLCFCSPTIDIWTDASGNINNWDVSLTVGELGSENITTEDFDAGIFRGIVIEDSGTTDNTGSDTASNTGDQGSWGPGVVASSTPEPGSLTLFGAGLAALAAAVRRRRSRTR
jgi:hypothetical protein